MNLVFLFIVSNAASVLIGWLLGKTGRNAAVVAAAVETEGGDEPPRKERIRPFRVLGVVVMAISAVTALNGFLVTVQTQELADSQKQYQKCVTEVLNKLTDSLLARSGASQDTLKQQDQIWFVVAEVYKTLPPDAGDRVRAAIELYVAARVEAGLALAEHPLPEPPRNVCVS